MTSIKTYNIINFAIAIVWVINGLFCKVLNLVPIHQQIVGEILSDDYSRVLTILIGLSELLMAIWVISKFHSRLNALVQMSIIGLMNVLEFILVPDLLLWGKLNSSFAILFILLIYFNEFYLNKKYTKQF